MKSFHQLTEEQQKNAIEFAKSVLEDCIEIGLFTTNRPASEKEIEELSVQAAEGSMYDDNGKAITGENVPPFYLGGCV